MTDPLTLTKDWNKEKAKPSRSSEREREHHWRLRWLTPFVVAALFIVWQQVNHYWLMRLPMKISHTVNVAIETLIAMTVTVIVVGVVTRYQRALERKNAELEQLHQLKEDLTNMIVHDMKSPLTAMLGGVQFARSDPEGRLSPVGDELLANAESSGKRLLSMMDNLLHISRLEEGKLELRPEPFALNQLVAECCAEMSPLARERDVKLVSALPSDLPVAWGDRDLTRRVLDNLMSNALRHSPTGGAVCVKASANGAGAIEVRVTDHGEGIPPHLHRALFEKFYQVNGSRQRRGSAGLGLAFCKLAVEAWGGRIGVYSDVGKGSTFFFTLPARERTVTSDQ